jgi:hypothetical protein
MYVVGVALISELFRHLYGTSIAGVKSCGSEYKHFIVSNSTGCQFPHFFLERPNPESLRASFFLPSPNSNDNEGSKNRRLKKLQHEKHLLIQFLLVDQLAQLLFWRTVAESLFVLSHLQWLTRSWKLQKQFA